MSVNPIPAGYHSVTPYLYIDGADAAIRFYGEAFGAIEVVRMPAGDRIMHAEIRIGDSHVMLADENPEQDVLSPTSRGGATSSLMIYLPDVDAVFARAVAAGATSVREPTDQFWGDRMGVLTDPFGHQWSLATHIEDVSPDEIEQRMAEAFKQPA